MIFTIEYGLRSQPYQEIQTDARLLKQCFLAAQQEIGTIESNQDAIDSWAMFLYFQAKQEITDCSELTNK